MPTVLVQVYLFFFFFYVDVFSIWERKSLIVPTRLFSLFFSLINNRNNCALHALIQNVHFLPLKYIRKISIGQYERICHIELLYVYHEIQFYLLTCNPLWIYVRIDQREGFSHITIRGRKRTLFFIISDNLSKEKLRTINKYLRSSLFFFDVIRNCISLCQENDRYYAKWNM